MSTSLLVLLILASVDPPRGRLAARASGVSPAAWAGAAGLTFVVVASAALAGDAVIGGLEVRAESWRIATGIVAGFTAVRRLLSGAPVAEPTLRPGGAALIPGVFPILLRPVVLMVAVAGGVDHGAAATVVGFLVALAAAAAAGGIPRGETHIRLWLAASKLLAALLVVGAVSLIISGIADI